MSPNPKELEEKLDPRVKRTRNLILAVCEFLSNVHSQYAQPRQQFESLVEGTIKKQIFELLTLWLKQTRMKISTEIPTTVATWAIYGLASYYSHLTPPRVGGAREKRPRLEKFVNKALPLVAVNLEQFTQPA
jgi:hypothetical protein